MGKNNPVNLLRGFPAAKCLMVLNLAISRIKVTRNRRNLLARQIRGDIAQLFRSGQAAHVYDTKIASLIREENTVAAYDLIDRYCHQIVSQFSTLETQRYCAPELKEPIASLIYAAPRCSDLPELTEAKDMLTIKYGKEFTVAANEIKPDCGVSREIIELMSMQPPSGKIKLKLMKDICLQHKIEWRSEWVPEVTLSTPDSKKREMDNVNAQRALSNNWPLKGDQDMHHNRGLILGEDLILKRQEARGSIRSAADGMVEPYQPAVGLDRGMLRREQVSKIDMEASQRTEDPYDTRTDYKGENVDDLHKSASSRRTPKQGSFPKYEPASPGYDLKQGSCFLREELARSDIRVSDNRHSPQSYGPGFGPLLGEKATRANMKGANEPYKPGSVLMHDTRDNDEVVSEGNKGQIYKASRYSPLRKQLHEPGKTKEASLGRHKVPDYQEENNCDRAENLMQHPDEISDSGSDIFVHVEDDDAALFQKEVTSTASSVSRNSSKEGKSSNTNLRATASKESGYPRSNSQRGNMENENVRVQHPWVEKVVQESAASSPDIADVFDEHEFTSTAKAIAEEAARLAILNYAKQYSRSRSSSKNDGNVTVDNTNDNSCHSRPEGRDAADDENGDFKKKGTGYLSNMPSKTRHDENPHASSKLFAAIASSDGKIDAERQALGRAHAQIDRESSGSYNADVSKRPVFDEEQDFTYERSHRGKHIEGTSGRHEFSSNTKARKLFPDEYDPYFDAITRGEEPTHPNQVSRENSKSHSSSGPHDEYHNNKWAPSTGTGGCDKKGAARAPQSINYNDDKRDRINVGTKSHSLCNRNSQSSFDHEEDLDYIEKGKVETSSLCKGAPNQVGKNAHRRVSSAATVKDNEYVTDKQTDSALQNQGTLHQDNLSEAKMSERRTRSVDGQKNPASSSGKMTYQNQEKSVVNKVPGARWHKEEASGKVMLQDKEERFWGLEATHNRQQEPAKWSELPTKDNHKDNKTPLQPAQDPDLAKRPMSVRKKSQGLQEEAQPTASGYKPYVQKQEVCNEERMFPSKLYDHDQSQYVMHHSRQDTWPAGREQQQNKSLHPKASPFAVDPPKHVKENAFASSANGLDKPRPEHHEEGQEEDCKQYHREHKRPTAFTSGCQKQDEPNSSHMSVNQVSEPPTRSPPPLPQKDHPSKGPEWNQQPLMYGNQKGHHKQDEPNSTPMIANRVSEPPTRNPPPLPQINHPSKVAEWNQQPLMYENQKQQVQQEDENGDAKQLHKRAPPWPRRPPPAIVRTSEREQAEKQSGVQVRSLPEGPRIQKPSSSTAASSGSHNVVHEPACPSPKPQTSVSASLATGDAPKTPPKLPHVDDIAANLEALRQARLRKDAFRKRFAEGI
ncbi:hypothetical protein GOP47_0016106 [Adiantum capillus-veneris]|uniref:Uncharacterized protein n=1 Tax=Adiantum capillus-veneris TaxID=13818 RepID=A0A9D4UKY8_ADICA|nr:hypothetical protein GOP47_0015703 [Adiantum capillus-veneris]KAI5069805.1 hypothetical protein GOP47_0016106 [Adiantum capillus-veneris]